MSFRTIKGQDSQVSSLKEFLAQGRIASSYLFSGPEAVGKKFTALALAKALNCDQAVYFDSCDNCPSCRKIDKLEHPDVHLISGDAVKIEDIRQLKKDIMLRPYEGNFKVFIIDNAHTLTAEAAGALLKVLEEPPKQSLIILVTSKPALLFKTIVSRCRMIKFSSLPRKELEEILSSDYGLANDYVHYLSYFSEGKIGYALKLKDSDLFREKNRIIDDFLLRNEVENANFTEYTKEDIKLGLNMLAIWFRDIYFIKAGLKEEEIINSDRERELKKSAASYSFLDLDRIFKCIVDSLTFLEQNLNTKLLLSNLSFCLKG